MKAKIFTITLVLISISHLYADYQEVYKFQESGIDIVRKIETTTGSIATIFTIKYEFPENITILDLSLPTDEYSSKILSNSVEINYYPKEVGEIEICKDVGFLIFDGTSKHIISAEPVKIKVNTYFTSDQLEKPEFDMYTHRHDPYKFIFFYGFLLIFLFFASLAPFVLFLILLFSKKKRVKQIFNPDSILKIENKLKLFAYSQQGLAVAQELNCSSSLKENATNLITYFSSLLEKPEFDSDSFKINRQRLANLYHALVEKDQGLVEKFLKGGVQ
ncbi:MAG: hypothetical protein JXR63_06235 [Spirochaetales bacterium]|nr:hypothetical protein [Spirochaetales bacterium]